MLLTERTNKLETAFDTLLPRDTVVVEASSSGMWEHGLLAEELPHIAHAGPKRRREFTAGRNCARCALASLGIEPMEIGVGADRQPLFPYGISGSITHSDGYCAASVIHRGTIFSIGIDAEIAEPLGADIQGMILLPEEQRMVAALAGTVWFPDKLVFSIKEAFYKAFYQRAECYLDFLEARVQIIPEQSSFTIGVLRTDIEGYFRDNLFRGHYAYDSCRIYSAIALPS